MQSISTTHPLQVLTELETTCKRHQTRTVKHSSEAQRWSGLGFRIAKYKYCISSKDIDEILGANFQKNLSTVPGAKAWLCGLISLRGQALPVIDLQQYLFDEKSVLSNTSRLLVIDYSNMKIGLIIDETCGLKRFEQNSSKSAEEMKTLPPEVLKYTSQVFHVNEQSWIEFSVKQLENDPNFLNAARF